MGSARSAMSPDDAETLALKALGFLASDGERLGRFMALTGLSGDDLRSLAGEPATLVAVIDHLLADQTLLLVFCAEGGVAPERVEEARRVLSGARGEAKSTGAWH